MKELSFDLMLLDTAYFQALILALERHVKR